MHSPMDMDNSGMKAKGGGAGVPGAEPRGRKGDICNNEMLMDLRIHSRM